MYERKECKVEDSRTLVSSTEIFSGKGQVVSFG
jgi:hypothetical protein